MIQIRRLLPALLLPLLTIAAGAGAAPTYSVVAIGEDFEVSGLNNAGQVFGYNGNAGTVFVWSGGVTTFYPEYSTGNGINDSGTFLARDATYQAVTVSAGGATPRGDLQIVTWSGNGINNSNQITGSMQAANSSPHAFLSSPNGSLVDIGSLGGADNSSYGLALNNAGVVVGVSGYDATENMHAFMYSENTIRDLGTLGGYSEAVSVNDNGIAAGTSYLDSGDMYSSRAVIFDHGNVIDLSGVMSAAHDINNAGDVVGISWGDAFVYTGGQLLNLNSLLDPAYSGWRFYSAEAINDSGQIVALGIDADNRYQLALLTPAGMSVSPVPEPGRYSLLLAGIALLGFVRFRRHGG